MSDVFTLQGNIAKFYAASNAKQGDAFYLLPFGANC